MSSQKLKKIRADVLVHETGLAESRQKAQALIMSGNVIAHQTKRGEWKITKAGELIPEDTEIRLKGEQIPYVSRAGLKLEAAIHTFHPPITNSICLDIGASTGGFTDCLLQHGAQHIISLDVGFGQLHPTLRNDNRVTIYERTNIRTFNPSHFPQVDGIVIDVSFISLSLALIPALTFLKQHGWVIALIKPQFEAGKGQVGKGGVIKDEALRQKIVSSTIEKLIPHGLKQMGIIDSPISGRKKGNIESLFYSIKM